MPAIPPGSLVLVTGASGFIGAQTAKAFLDNGYPVRGTVRSASKGEYLRDLFKDSKVPFEYVLVEDIGENGAFDEAVKDVVGVAHTASPFHYDVQDPEEFIRPAVDGTLGVLRSIKKNNPGVKRVVITSSCAAIMDTAAPTPNVRTEKDWNETSIRNVEEKGRRAEALDKYRASKTLAERALWKFIADEKPNFDAVAINPPMVYGPIIQQVSKRADLNTSNGTILEWFTSCKQPSEIPQNATTNWVDVRDVALAHVRALSVPEAGGERFIVGNGPSSPNDYVLSFERHFPERSGYPKGDESKVESINANSNRYDGSKAERVLGIKYHDIDTSIHDTVESLISRLGI